MKRLLWRLTCTWAKWNQAEKYRCSLSFLRLDFFTLSWEKHKFDLLQSEAQGMKNHRCLVGGSLVGKWADPHAWLPPPSRPSSPAYHHMTSHMVLQGCIITRSPGKILDIATLHKKPACLTHFCRSFVTHFAQFFECLGILFSIPLLGLEWSCRPFHILFTFF